MSDWLDHLLNSDSSDSEAVRMVEGKQQDPLYSFLQAHEFGEGLKIDGDQYQGLVNLTDSWRAKHALDLPVEAGTKVKFISNTSSVFAYDDPPAPNMTGEVIEVKTATGIATGIDDRVFVKFDDGKLRAISAEHLAASKGTARRSTASVNKIRTASLDMFLDSALGEFTKVAEDTLINRSSRDLWSLSKDGDEYVIERLFDENGSPLTV